MNLTTQVTIEYLKELPIVEINLKNKKEKEEYESVIKSVDEIQTLTIHKQRNEINIKATQKAIDKIVYKLYGITPQEQKIIEEE